jgi:hypothetical protein
MKIIPPWLSLPIYSVTLGMTQQVVGGRSLEILTPLRLNKSNNKTITCSCGLACTKSAAMMLDIEYV